MMLRRMEELQHADRVFLHVLGAINGDPSALNTKALDLFLAETDAAQP